MAASELIVKTISRAGLDLALETWNADGMYFENAFGKRTCLVVSNGGDSPITLAVTIQKTVDGVTPAAKSLTVPAGKTYIFGPFAPEDYNDNSGYVRLPAAVAATTTVAAVWLPWE